MIIITEKTEAFVSESIADIFNEVINICIPRGLYYFRAGMSSDDTEAFDHYTIQEIDRTKWRWRGEGFHPEIRYLRHERWFLMFSDQSAMFRGPHTGDIRETPIGFCGYEISCNRNERGDFTGSVDYSSNPGERWVKNPKSPSSNGPSAQVVAERIRSLFDVRSPDAEKQLEEWLKDTNRMRGAAGLELLTREQVGLGAAQSPPKKV